nr:efflux RND transporter periplasmic adaptor subunit [Microvirga puerhi]
MAAGAYFLVIRRGERPSPAQTASGAPPPEVGVVVAQPAEVPFPVEFAGRIASVREVEVRSRVSGLLLKRDYEEGTLVKQDQVLFQIDPATYQVAQSRSEAQLAQAQAALRQADDNFARIEELSRRQVAAERQLEEARGQRDQARASVQLAEAELQGAKLNLSYTTIMAPIAGVTALQSPPVGTLVQAQQTLLTTITPLDPAYVNFSFSDEEAQAFRELNARREKPISERDLVLKLQYAPGTTYPQDGRVDMAAQRVDPQTGTIQARGVFPNPDGVLLPGLFVRIRVLGITLPDAIVIPQEAVSQGPQGPTVYVIGEKDVAQVRPIRLGPAVAGGWVVREGLRSGDRVIVDGVIRVRPGAVVKPVPMKTNPQEAQTQDNSGQPAPGARP